MLGPRSQAPSGERTHRERGGGGAGGGGPSADSGPRARSVCGHRAHRGRPFPEGPGDGARGSAALTLGTPAPGSARPEELGSAVAGRAGPPAGRAGGHGGRGACGRHGPTTVLDKGDAATRRPEGKAESWEWTGRSRARPDLPARRLRTSGRGLGGPALQTAHTALVNPCKRP